MFCPYTYFTNNTTFGVFTPTEHTYVSFHLLVFSIMASVYSFIMMCITSFNNNDIDDDDDYEVLQLGDTSDSEMDTSEDEVDTSNDTQHDKLQKRIKNLERDIRNYRRNATKDQDEISSLQSERNNNITTIKCQQEKINSLTSESWNIVESNMLYSERILELERELEKCRGKIYTFTNLKTSLQTKIESLSLENETLRPRIESLRLENESLQQKLNEVSSNTKTNEQQLEVANISISNMTDQIDDLQQQIIELQYKNSLLQQRIEKCYSNEYDDSRYQYLLDSLELMTNQQLINITTKTDRDTILPDVNSKRKLKYTALYNYFRTHHYTNLMDNCFQDSKFTVAVKKHLSNNRILSQSQYHSLVNDIFLSL